MKKYLIILSTLAVLACCGCSTFAGDPITKDFTISGSYTKLEVSHGFDVTVSDVATQVTVTAGENIMPKVVVEIVNNTLRIRLKGWNVNNTSDMKVILPYNAALKSVDLSGASELHSVYTFEGEKVEVNLSGASEFHGNIMADDVDINMSGASDFTGYIKAEDIDMELSGGSNIEGYVESQDLDVELSGGSDASLNGIVNLLDMDISGASHIGKNIITENRYAFACMQCKGSLSGASDAYIHCDGSITVSLSGGSTLHYTGNASTEGSTNSGGSNIIHNVF